MSDTPSTLVSTKKIGRTGLIQATITGPGEYAQGDGFDTILNCAAIDSVISVVASNGDLCVPFKGDAPDHMPNSVNVRCFYFEEGIAERDGDDLSGVTYTVTYTAGPTQQPYEVQN